ncbi:MULTISPECIES: hypothetical protein [unclassified Spirosoma]|uniref:hypothetical protein n=1 Tax=unclassified Spirosoma TaxID=2621999 RepID=UPI00095E9958|nr:MULTISPECIES: hypothetical protein [unclassified Spirosoma]MBN8821310.1 hypothetical protein [Spirosoma sp.]OJW78099.1 MAG: hypothetical protein BGO59_29205 [Spirosoma sp. 48-14]
MPLYATITGLSGEALANPRSTLAIQFPQRVSYALNTKGVPVVYSFSPSIAEYARCFTYAKTKPKS